MPFTIFFAWQSDRASDVCRTFIEDALHVAKDEFGSRKSPLTLDIEIPPFPPETTLHQGSAGAAGAPYIPEKIFERIAKCDVFIPDLTIVEEHKAASGKLKQTPNGNVLVETGYAAGTGGGWDRMVLVMNTAFGEPEQLPFDLNHRECKVLYKLAEASDPDAAPIRSNLVKKLVDAIEQIYAETLRRQEITDLSEITTVIPAESIPIDGNWRGPEIAAANVRLAREIVGRPARLKLKTAKVEQPPNGRYRDLTRILADLPDDATAGLKVLLYSYRPLKALPLLQMAQGKDEWFRGFITRADIDRDERTNIAQLNIDIFSRKGATEAAGGGEILRV